MSLILEALRKSEAERRRGEAPDLRVELPPMATTRPRTVPAWAWIAGAALVLLVATVALWPRGRGPGVEGGTQRLPEPVADRVATDAVVARRSSDRPEAVAPGHEAFPHVDRIAPAAAPAPVARNTAAPPEPAPRTAAPADHPPDVAPPPRADPVPTPAPVRDATAVRPAALPVASGIPRITELAPAQRQRLPAMKLSMHMWNEDPARRFVVIDGQRKAEGDRVGDAAVTAIDRDGVVLELDGQAVRVPLP
jgi:general secretion pathway protein B